MNHPLHRVLAHTIRRLVLRRPAIGTVAAGLLAASLPLSGLTQETYPTKSVRMIVPFSPGGASDILARFVAKGLSERWKQSVVVENKPGASGIIGTEMAAKSPADGYTLVFATISNLAVNPTLFEGRLPYDSSKSFAPLTLAASIPMMLVVNQEVPANSVPDLIKLMREKAPLNYGSGGNGTTQHLAMEMFKTAANVPATHIAYKSSAPAMVELIGGQISLMIDNLNTAMPHVTSGKLKALAVTTPQRTTQAPAVPTLAEQGLTGAEIGTWFAFLAPAGTPEPIVRKINADMVTVLTDSATNGMLVSQGMEIIASSPERLATHIREEIAKWAVVVKAANIKVD